MIKSWRVAREKAAFYVLTLSLRFTFHVLLFSLLAAAVGGCKKKIPLIGGTPGPFPVEITVRTQPDLNQGNSNQGNSVVFCVYQLQADTKFREATSESFWREGEKILEKDLLGQKFETTLYPNQTEKLNIKVSPEARFLGLVANFHSPDAQRWHLVVPISVFRSRKIVIDAGKDFLNFARP
jgi:type VI secretion system protein VasD